MDDHGIAELTDRLRRFAAARDWQRFHTPKNLATALIVEAAELNEVFQWLTPDESTRVMENPQAAERVRGEIADVLAYLLQLASACGVDPVRALAEKLDHNEQRFPVELARGRAGGGRPDREFAPDQPVP
jgi:NTP pyrophosphatase (non-canonical NTP hydrolase)